MRNVDAKQLFHPAAVKWTAGGTGVPPIAAATQTLDGVDDELIRSLGVASVEQVIGARGDLRSFRIFQKQPAHCGRAAEAQLRRFMGTRGGRKPQYARVLVDALDLTHVPRPPDLVLAHI